MDHWIVMTWFHIQAVFGAAPSSSSSLQLRQCLMSAQVLAMWYNMLIRATDCHSRSHQILAGKMNSYQVWVPVVQPVLAAQLSQLHQLSRLWVPEQANRFQTCQWVWLILVHWVHLGYQVWRRKVLWTLRWRKLKLQRCLQPSKQS